jgi:hypothetical protein
MMKFDEVSALGKTPVGCGVLNSSAVESSAVICDSLLISALPSG